VGDQGIGKVMGQQALIESLERSVSSAAVVSGSGGDVGDSGEAQISMPTLRTLAMTRP
jgi:hypothetical protein